MDATLEHALPEMTDDSVEQMLALAERLREANGGELDESAVQAVAEATGVSLEYVRLAVKLRAEKEKTGFFANLRAQFLLMGADTRRYVSSGLAAAMAAMFAVVGTKLDQITYVVNNSQYGVFGMISLVIAMAAAYNVSLAREARTATLAGAIFGGGYYLISALFSMILQVRASFGELMLIPFTIGGALLGLLLFKVLENNRTKLGLKDPVKDRQDLLRQLHDLQDKLRSGRQSISFLSLDIVGSTKMKQDADHLAVEFTFNEYHEFVDRITRKYGGRVHSTAGDGIICAFDTPSVGLAAAKNIQTGLIELNAFRNRIGIPLVLRAGIHSGTIVAPDAEDVTSVNFTHVIDMAAHIQKACPPGGIAVSEAACSQLPGGRGSVGTDTVRVMDMEAAVWQPRQSLSLGTLKTPPLPEGA